MEDDGLRNPTQVPADHPKNFETETPFPAPMKDAK